MDSSLPGSSIHGILQKRIQEWLAIPFPRGLSNSGIEPMSPTLQAGALLSEPPGKPYAQTDQKNRSTIWRFSNESQKHAALAWNQAADGGWWDGAARRTMRKMLPEGGERGLTCALAGWTGSRPAPCGKVQHSQGAQRAPGRTWLSAECQAHGLLS